MHEISVVLSFSAAHNLRGYRGKCEELHGHNWKVKAAVRSAVLNETGMVVDFSVIKKALKSLLMKLDHAYLNETPYFKKINPTSENIAAWIYGQLKKKFSGKVILSYVKVWETESSCACYSEP